MGQDAYYELSRKSIIINKNEEPTLQRSNDFLTVRTDKCIHFFNFSCNLECLDKNIDLSESSLNAPIHSPATALFKAKFLRNVMRNLDLTEMILNSFMWPHNEQLMQEMTIVSAAIWSPKGFLHNEGVIAVLNNIGGVELFALQDHKWASIINFSNYIKQCFEYNKAPKNVKDLKQSVYILAVTSICWASSTNLDKTCYFVTAQKNGTIIFWSIQQDIMKTCIKGKFETNCDCDIVEMIWVPVSNEKFWLVCSNVFGQILAYECVIEGDDVKLIQCHTLWGCKDRMIGKYLKYTVLNNTILFLCSKHRHLIVQAVDCNGGVISQHINNINDYRITSIIDSIDGIYVSTLDCKTFKMNITIKEGGLIVDYQQIEIKESYTSHELFGISFSQNNIIYIQGMLDRRILCRKESHKFDIMFLSTERKLEQLLPMLLSTQSLTDYWDCIETLRYKMVKLKTLSQTDCDLLTAASNDNTKLKLFLVIAIIYNNLMRVIKFDNKVKLPNTSIDMIKEQLLLSIATSLLNSMHSKHQNDRGLNDFEKESFAGAKRYLEYYCNKYKKDASEFIDINILNTSNSSYKYICQWCDEKIDGFMCKDGHMNVFCSHTFTLITNDDYLSCKLCGCTVSSIAHADNPLCVFCDVYLNNDNDYTLKDI